LNILKEIDQLLLIGADRNAEFLTLRISTLIRVGLLQAERSLRASCLGASSVDKALIELREGALEHRNNDENC
jgi:hypothetical protein